MLSICGVQTDCTHIIPSKYSSFIYKTQKAWPLCDKWQQREDNWESWVPLRPNFPAEQAGSYMPPGSSASTPGAGTEAEVYNTCSRTPTSTLSVPIVLGEQNILICVLSQQPSPITFLRCPSHTTTPLPGSSEVPNQCHGPNFLPKSKPQEPWALALALPIFTPTRYAPEAALRCTSLITSNPRRMKTKTRHSPGTEVQRCLHRPGAGSQERAHNSSEWQKNEDGREGEDWASPVCF